MQLDGGSRESPLQAFDVGRYVDRFDFAEFLQAVLSAPGRGGRRAIEVSEDVVGLGRFGKTLTVLYDMELPDEEEEADEAALSDSWTPRFRR